MFYLINILMHPIPAPLQLARQAEVRDLGMAHLVHDLRGSPISPQLRRDLLRRGLPRCVGWGSGCTADEPGKLHGARSRLYRRQILQENTRLKALAEMYKMHSFALL